ncbi:MAG: TonB-dependent receptor [Chitinophagaceae bacterium]|nr:TonB-dependent receptor [Chitinophagaceae bacterium]
MMVNLLTSPGRTLFKKSCLKLTLIIAQMLLVVSVAFCEQHPQKLTISGSNIPLQKVFQAIKKQTGLTVFYSNELINDREEVSLNFKNEPVEHVLDYLFKEKEISYEIKTNKVIVLSKNPKKETKDAAQAIPVDKDIVVRGRVTDEQGEPLQGVSVVVKRTKETTLTDANGNFQITVDNKNDILVFSFVGFETREAAANAQGTVNITLKLADKSLEQVVVVGYGTAKKASLTSAVTSVNTELLEDRAIPKLSTALQGITPGVEIRQSSGRPGYSASKFDIRGASLGTFSNNSALILVDGIVVSSIDDVNPNDIENISILKDAAAAAIYGSRATGGVVLITTKRGTKDKLTVNYTGTFSAERNPLSGYKNKMVDSQTWLKATNEGSLNDGAAVIYSDELIASYDGSDPLKPAKTKWFDWIKSYSPQYMQNISVRGGTEKLNVYSSLGYVSQTGLLDNDDYKRYNFQTNVNWKVTNRLDVGFNIFYSKEDFTRPIGTVAPNLLRPLLNPPITVFQYPSGAYNPGPLGFGSFNAIQAMKEGGNTISDLDKYRISADAKYRIVNGLFLNYTIALNNAHSQGNTFYNMLDILNSDGVVTGRSNPFGQAYSTASESWNMNRYLSNLLKLDYSGTFGEHAVTAMAGFQTETNRYDEISARAYRFVNNDIRELSGSVGAGTDLYGTTGANEWSIASLIGRVTYSFKNRYLLEYAMRYDGSSRFSKNNRWALFPSVSAAWRLEQENFLQSVDWISNLKLRASYGQLGNQGTALYPFATLVSNGTWAFGNGAGTTTSLGTPADPNLSWETKSTTNLGLDWGLFNQRLTGSFDWFYDRTKDIIATPVVPSTFGASAPVQNTFTVDNRGWEFEIRWSDRIGDLRYYVGGNIFNARDKVVSLGGLGSTDPRYEGGKLVLNAGAGTYYAEGKSRNSLYLYQTEGLFVDQSEIDHYVKPSTLTKPGDIKFIDRNGDGAINSNDRYFSDKNTTPHYIYGINLGAAWKGFDISVVFNGVGERWGYRNLDGHYMTGNRLSLAIFQSNYDNRWSPENPDKWADQPRLTNNNWISGEFSTMFSAPNEYHLRNMKYIRLKNLQVGYTIPPSLIQRSLKLTNVRVYFTGENLFYIARGYKELLDPEAFWSTVGDADASGTVYYGPSAVLSGGLSVTF